ncbi:hypothetical protein GGR57DRAFT_483369 [Xylariaceae sp. FL1272]|nr:hypothetical protein GGR57DRAFT_483369 [Xylariaceae sp. FL1272]
MYNQQYGQGHYPPPHQGGHPPYPPQQPPQQGHYPPSQAHSPYPPQGAYPPYGAPPPAHHGYGAPPPGPAPGQYPPPQGHSSYPPYGAQPPAQQGYGAPPPGPPPGQYGAHSSAPPPQQYGAPQFAAPPGGGGGPPNPPSPGYGPPQSIHWDANPDAKALRDAMRGFGANKKELTRVLARLDPLQVEALKSAYVHSFHKGLEEDINSETTIRGHYAQALVAIVRGPLLNDVHLLHKAMAGAGTNRTMLNDILLGRSNADMNAIKRMYQQTFHKSLESEVSGELTLKTEKHFMIVVGACRAEDSAPVIPQAIDQDAQAIYNATEGKYGADQAVVFSILSTRNDNQIRAINYTYEQKYRSKLETVIKKEFSGHMEDALLFQLRHAVDKYMNAATLFEDAMAGAGTKDDLLVARVVRYHWDRQTMENIKGAFKQRYGKSLASRIRGETSSDYGSLMVACVGE